MSRLECAVFAAVLLLQAIVCIHAATRLTVTHDEYWHLPIGLHIWQTGRFDQDRINPPLVRVWSALPLVMTGTPMNEPDGVGETAYGDALLRTNPDHYPALLRYGRLMIVPIGVAVGAIMFLWMRRHLGRAPAWMALLLWMTSPNAAAHGSLVTHDMAATAAYLGTAIAADRWLRRPGNGTAIVVGVVLGIALLTKFTAVMLVPFVLCWWLCGTIPSLRGRLIAAPDEILKTSIGRYIRNRVGELAIIAVVATVVLNTGYVWRGSFSTLGDLPLTSSRLLEWRQESAWFAAVPLPAPEDYVLGIDQLSRFMEQSHPVYLDGEWRTSGFRDYYARALMVKLPHGLQLAGVCGAVLLWRRRRDSSVRRFMVLWIMPAVVLFLSASLSDNQLGLRYILPIFPCLCMLGGMIAASDGRERGGELTFPTWQRGVIAIVVLSALTALRHHPHHLAYFNEAAGGPNAGRYYLVDSNLDWGQGLHDLRRAVDDPARFRTAYFGTFPPSAAGFPGSPPPSFAPEPGRYVVSVNYVMGRPHTLRLPDGGHRAVGIDEFGYFRFFEPTTTIGGSIDVYELSEVDVARWRAAAMAAGLRQ